jgi:HSP20 family molecular chaperone IbpA
MPIADDSGDRPSSRHITCPYRRDRHTPALRRRMERSSMFGQRSVKLPANVDAAHIDARVENGVLLVTVPKTEPAASQRKRISVA